MTHEEWLGTEVDRITGEYIATKNELNKIMALLSEAKEMAEFYALEARYEWSSDGGLVGESLIQDHGKKAHEFLKKVVSQLTNERNKGC